MSVNIVDIEFENIILPILSFEIILISDPIEDDDNNEIL